MLRQISALTACTSVRGNCRSHPTKWCEPLTFRNSSHCFQHFSNPYHPVCHLQKLHFPHQLYALPSSTNTVLCGPLYMPLRMWQNVVTDWQTFNVTVSKYIATNRRIIILCLVIKQTVEIHQFVRRVYVCTHNHTSNNPWIISFGHI